MRVGDDRDFLDVRVMISNEAEVGDHRPETIPPRKGRGAEDEAGQIAVCLDLGSTA
jgi:hypothetical protein